MVNLRNDKLEKYVETDTDKKEVSNTELNAIGEAEVKEEPNSETIVTFTEEKRLHEDFSKFYKRFK